MEITKAINARIRASLLREFEVRRVTHTVLNKQEAFEEAVSLWASGAATPQKSYGIFQHDFKNVLENTVPLDLSSRDSDLPPGRSKWEKEIAQLLEILNSDHEICVVAIQGSLECFVWGLRGVDRDVASTTKAGDPTRDGGSIADARSLVRCAEEDIRDAATLGAAVHPRKKTG